MKRVIAIVICICIALLVGMSSTWYWYRWANFPNRPLFFNAYSTQGLDRWRWRFKLAGVVDDQGRMLLVDSKINMIAIVFLPSKASRTFEDLVNTPKEFNFTCDEKRFKITATPGTLIVTDGTNTLTQRPMAPGEAKALHEADDSDSAVERSIDRLMNPLIKGTKE